MCVYIQEAIYDEDAVIAIVDSDTVLTMVQKHLDLSIRYQDELDNFLSLENTNKDDINKVNKIRKELATYRKALQITLPNSVKIV